MLSALEVSVEHMPPFEADIIPSTADVTIPSQLLSIELALICA